MSLALPLAARPSPDGGSAKEHLVLVCKRFFRRRVVIFSEAIAEENMQPDDGHSADPSNGACNMMSAVGGGVP